MTRAMEHLLKLSLRVCWNMFPYGYLMWSYEAMVAVVAAGCCGGQSRP